MLPYRVLPLVCLNNVHDLYVLCPGALHQCVCEGHWGVNNKGALEAWLAQLTSRPLQCYQGGGFSNTASLGTAIYRLDIGHGHAAQPVQHPECG